MSNQRNLKEGDSVIVKPGVKDPDTDKNISGWQGRISDISEDDGESIASIHWDSVTLKKMPLSMIEYCEDEGLDWREMRLGVSDVKPASPRDAEEDVEKAIEEIESQTAWLFLGEEDKRIQQVLAGIATQEPKQIMEDWETQFGRKI